MLISVITAAHLPRGVQIVSCMNGMLDSESKMISYPGVNTTIKSWVKSHALCAISSHVRHKMMM